MRFSSHDPFLSHSSIACRFSTPHLSMKFFFFSCIHLTRPFMFLLSLIDIFFLLYFPHTYKWLEIWDVGYNNAIFLYCIISAIDEKEAVFATRTRCWIEIINIYCCQLWCALYYLHGALMLKDIFNSINIQQKWFIKVFYDCI